VNHNSHTAIY